MSGDEERLDALVADLDEAEVIDVIPDAMGDKVRVGRLRDAEAHGGKPCDCPVPTEEEIAAQWAERDRQHRAEAHSGGKCTCPPEEAPF